MSTTDALALTAADLDAALPADIKVLDPKALCQTYQKIKPILRKALPFIELLPWGAPVAKAIRTLMLIADKFCPA